MDIPDDLTELLYDLVEHELADYWIDIGSKRGKEFEKVLEDVIEHNLKNFVYTLSKEYKKEFEKYGVKNPEDIADYIMFTFVVGYELPEHLKHLEKIEPEIVNVFEDIDNWISEMYEKAERRIRKKKR